jgi:transcription elongation factor Elf1
MVYYESIKRKGNSMSFWNGSGIDSEDYSGIFYCSACEDEFELDGVTNDSHSMAYATCPDCGKELDTEIERDEPDPDAVYEAWRDSQLGE